MERIMQEKETQSTNSWLPLSRISRGEDLSSNQSEIQNIESLSNSNLKGEGDQSSNWRDGGIKKHRVLFFSGLSF